MDKNKGISLKITRPEKNADVKESWGYEVRINGHKIEQGINAISLDMVANKKPVLTIKCWPDAIEADLQALVKLMDISEKNKVPDVPQDKLAKIISEFKKVEDEFALRPQQLHEILNYITRSV
ncbi:hypothetical protein [Pediococcus acidilactici]|uniref:hypothetical protein n=1 Tax=Pediococcus acidilactici TaxID=1254 RepID=UPI00254DE7AA|nr:hypothetical protein [Pediococcus acidilactici]WIL71512.1 hypothetical protein QMY06_07810 [Pediococcus acidilactici]